MVSENPLRPSEDEYRTEIDTDETDVADSSAETAPPWIAIGLVLLVIFVALLAYAVVLPLVR